MSAFRALTDTCDPAYSLLPMNVIVTVDLGDRMYNIHVGSGVLRRLGGLCRGMDLGKRCLVVSDSNVDPLYG